MSIGDVDAIAATAGPGLIGGVMVALLAGKGLALAAGKPLIAVNHLEGHALSPRLADPDLGFPYLLLLVSGGHCQLLEVQRGRRLPAPRDHDRRCRGRGVRQGREAARPRLTPADRRSRSWRRTAIRPRCRCRARCVGSGEPHFSFAGLKSAVQRAVASGDFRRRGHRRKLPAGGRRLPGRPHRLALERQRCARTGRRRRRRGQPGDPHRACRSRAARKAAASACRPAGCAPTMRR